MNCETSSQWISRSLDHELPDAEQSALDEHLAQCPACGKLARAQRSLDAAVAALPAAELPPDYSRRLREEVWRKVRTPARQPISIAFRVLSLAAVAAILMLSAAVMLLAQRLNDRQKEIRRLEAARETARRDEGRSMPFLPTGMLPRNGWAEPVQAFGDVQDYLGGSLRWMAVDGRQVEVGSGSTSGQVSHTGASGQVVVLTLQYIERQSDNTVKTLSKPQFILLPGEEASVRLVGRDAASSELFRYRVKAAQEKDGQISARIAFSCESPVAEPQRPVIDSPISADVLVKEGTMVLLGASGDATRRHELYLWAGTRPVAANGPAQPEKGTPL